MDRALPAGAAPGAGGPPGRRASRRREPTTTTCKPYTATVDDMQTVWIDFRSGAPALPEAP